MGGKRGGRGRYEHHIPSCFPDLNPPWSQNWLIFAQRRAGWMFSPAPAPPVRPCSGPTKKRVRTHPAAGNRFVCESVHGTAKLFISVRLPSSRPRALGALGISFSPSHGPLPCPAGPRRTDGRAVDPAVCFCVVGWCFRGVEGGKFLPSRDLLRSLQTEHLVI